MSLIFQEFSDCEPKSLAMRVLSSLTGFEVLKETKEQRLERIKRDWAVFKAKVAPKEKPLEPKREFATRPLVKDTLLSKPLRDLLQHKSHRKDRHGRINSMLRVFWGQYGRQSYSERLAELIALANAFKDRIKEKKLRKARKKYERNRHHLLNIPDCQCGTCEKKARVRHHIIPLYVGGPNNPLNLIMICDGCHETIHPWMRGR